MTKKRVIACLVVRDGIVVQSIGFHSFLPVGRPEIAARFLNDWGVDEIILLDIRASAERRLVDTTMVGQVARNCHVPLTVGGGIRNVDDIRRILRAGADKVSVNCMAVENRAALTEAANVSGNQCIIASVDVRQTAARKYRVFAHCGSDDTGLDPTDFVETLVEAGAGEILLNSIDCDGTRLGYDLELIDCVAAGVNVPVIALGGAGHPEHLREVLSRDHVSAAAAANFFHYTEHAVAVTKAYLLMHGIDVRQDALADYRWAHAFGTNGRIDRRREDELEKMIFEFIPEEVI